MPATRPTTIQQGQEILRLAESGMTVEAIAQDLQIAPRTAPKNPDPAIVRPKA